MFDEEIILPDADEMRGYSEEQQLSVMNAWFHSVYEDPAERTPYENAEGGYNWIWGGPYDAGEELFNKFEQIFPSEVIQKLADRLSAESWQWAPKPSWYDYDHDLFETIEENPSPHQTLELSLISLETLLAAPINGASSEALQRLLFANEITILEAYFSDTYIKNILSDKTFLRKHVETSVAYKALKISFNEIFKKGEGIEEMVTKDLLSQVWHRFPQVNKMYQDTFGIQIDGLPDLQKALQKRHDIVHRNGKDKNGNMVIVTKKEIEALANLIRKISGKIEAHLSQIVRM
jgi:hypothetical protein